MRQIPTAYSVLTFMDHVEHSDAALSAHPDTAHLAAPFRQETTGAEAMFAKERQASREVTRAEAVLGVRNAQLDATTIATAAAALADAGGQRNSAGFTRFFPTSPSSFVGQPLRKQCERTSNVLIPEIARAAAESAVKRFGDVLAGQVTGALQALDHRAAMKGNAAVLRNEVLEWKEGVNRLRTSTYGELLQVAAAKNHPKAWVETFFKGEPAKSEQEEPEGAGDGAPG